MWISPAMAAGLGLGRLIPDLNDALSRIEVGGTSLPIALGLLVMVYPVSAKVRYARLDAVTGDRRLTTSSPVVNWLVGPAVMFFGTFALGKAIGLAYDRTTTLAFAAAGNNLEPAIVVAIATFGVTSGQAPAGVVGPLIEALILIAPVYVAPARRKRFGTRQPTPAAPDRQG